jgi:hypothetical protein
MWQGEQAYLEYALTSLSHYSHSVIRALWRDIEGYILASGLTNALMQTARRRLLAVLL